MGDRRKDPGSALLGALAFLVGLGLVLFTFWQAWNLFQVPPMTALGLEKGKPIDPASAGGRLVWIIVQILLLMLMAGVGSVIAKWGIRMYGVRFSIPFLRDHAEPRAKADKDPAEAGKS